MIAFAYITHYITIHTNYMYMYDIIQHHPAWNYIFKMRFLK